MHVPYVLTKLRKIYNSSDIGGGIHTFSLYTYLVGLHVALLMYL